MPGDNRMPDFGDLPTHKPLFKVPGLRGIITIFAIVVCGLLILLGLGRYVYSGLGIEVTKPAFDGSQLTGKFNVYPKLFGFNSNGTGGACLIANIALLVSDADATAKGISPWGLHNGFTVQPVAVQGCQTRPSKVGGILRRRPEPPRILLVKRIKATSSLPAFRAGF